ncbi:hypothetical protein F5887DRAFT_1023313 [Amanita rubescens]|nr:hypothetical protein F5887DRAFT_1023313 [Amanita rubescens]
MTPGFNVAKPLPYPLPTHHSITPCSTPSYPCTVLHCSAPCRTPLHFATPQVSPMIPSFDVADPPPHPSTTHHSTTSCFSPLHHFALFCTLAGALMPLFTSPLPLLICSLPSLVNPLPLLPSTLALLPPPFILYYVLQYHVILFVFLVVFCFSCILSPVCI